MQKRYAALFAVAAAMFAGCLDRTPLWNPGTAEHQQQRAQHYDPYPEPDIGPDISDVRPRDFQLPVPEAERVHRTLPHPVVPYLPPTAVPVR